MTICEAHGCCAGCFDAIKETVEDAAKQSTGAGYDEWFIFDASETILAQGKD